MRDVRTILRSLFGRAGAIEAAAQRAFERSEAERELRAHEERLGLALDAAELGAWELDLAHGTVVRTLRHDQIFGYSSLQPEWSADIFTSHVIYDDRERVRKAFAEA